MARLRHALKGRIITHRLDPSAMLASTRPPSWVHIVPAMESCSSGSGSQPLRILLSSAIDSAQTFPPSQPILFPWTLMYAVDLYLTVFFLVGLWSVGHLLWIFVQKQLPSNKTRAVIAALHDADDVFRFSVEGGLLDAASASGFCYRLLGLHDRADTLCLRAFQATTWWEDLMNMRRGLSYEMTHLIREVRAVRARISAVSYVELQNVQLRTVDGKDIAQLRQEMTHESLAAALPASKSALLAVVATSDFKFGSARQTDEKVIASMAA